jgi:threonine aldolase
MRPDLVADVKYLRKQQLQLASKMRFLSAQFLALMEDDLWRHSASHANEMAQRLYQGVAKLPGLEVAYPVQSDAVFARLRPEHTEALQRDWYFYVWDEETSIVRWMTAFDTTETDVDQFVADIATVTGSH